MATLRGLCGWSAGRDSEGYREYTVRWKIDAAVTEGPNAILNVAGIYQPGDPYVVSIPGKASDSDLMAYCLPDQRVSMAYEDGSRCPYWLMEQKFTTKPRGGQNGGEPWHCQGQEQDDPLLKPQDVRGNFSSYTEEARTDRFGALILTSGHEPISGPQNEWDASRPGVQITQNVPDLQLSLLAALHNCLNDAPLWGLPERKIKLSSISWSKNYYGQCYVYYTRDFGFDIRYDGWDRDVLDEGTKVLVGHWATTDDVGQGGWVLDQVTGPGGGFGPPDPNNPSHFMRAIDRDGNPVTMILDGAGKPYDGTGDPGMVHIEKYASGNFNLLGIPLSF